MQSTLTLASMTDAAARKRKTWLIRLKREAEARRKDIVEALGPGGHTPLITIRVVEGEAGVRRHRSSEGNTMWIEGERSYFATFLGPDGKPGPEMAVEEDDALRWAFALDWGLS
jgi:hypothetical protein